MDAGSAYRTAAASALLRYWRGENCGIQLTELAVAGGARVKGTAASEDEAAVSP
jgi:hypothetical protein